MSIWLLEKEADLGALLVRVTGVVPVHVHPDGVHRMYVVRGAIEMRIGDEVSVARVGDFIVVPRGVPHGLALAEGATDALLGTVDIPPIDPRKTIWLAEGAARSP